MTVFDFSIILERTEKRVRDDLLGSGPKSVEELRAIEHRLRVKYKNQLERKKQQAARQVAQQEQLQLKQQQQQQQADSSLGTNMEAATAGVGETSRNVADQVMARATNLGLGNVASGATTMAAGVFAKIKSPGFNPLRNNAADDEEEGVTGTGEVPAAAAVVPPQQQQPPDLLTANSDDGGWIQSPIHPPTEAVENFSIGEDEEDDML